MGHEPRLSGFVSARVPANSCATIASPRSERRPIAGLRAVFAALAVTLLAGCGTLPDRADPASDTPEARTVAAWPVKEAATYHEALAPWHDAGGVNAWIGARFQYDMARTMSTKRRRD